MDAAFVDHDQGTLCSVPPSHIETTSSPDLESDPSLLFLDCLPFSLFLSILQQKFGDFASYSTCKNCHGLRDGFWTDFGLLARAPPEMSYEQDLVGIQLR